MDAQLVLNGTGAQVVEGSGSALVVHQLLGGEEQADALHAGGCIGCASQDQMADILRHIMVAPGDEDLLAGQPVAALSVWLSAGGHGGKV